MEGMWPRFPSAPRKIIFLQQDVGFLCSGNLPTLGRQDTKVTGKKGFEEVLVVSQGLPGVQRRGPDIWPRKLEAASVSCILSGTFHEAQNFCCLAARAAWTDFSATKILI